MTMDNSATLSWKDGLRIVDLYELAKQMYCRECRSLLDLNGTENEVRIGFASVLFIPCGCGVVNRVHTAKRLSVSVSCPGKQCAVEAYEINIKVSKGTASLTTADTRIIKHFLAFLHIPLESVPLSSQVAESIENTLLQCVYGQALQQNEDKCILERSNEQGLCLPHNLQSAGFPGLQGSLHLSAISETLITGVREQKQAQFLENAMLPDNTSVSLSASVVECLNGVLSPCSAGQNLVLSNMSDASESLCNGLPSVDCSWKLNRDSNNASESSSDSVQPSNGLNSIDISLFELGKGKCKEQAVTAVQSSSKQRKSSERATGIDETIRKTCHIADSLASPPRKKLQKVAKKRKDCGQHIDGSGPIVLQCTVYGESTSSLDGLPESRRSKRSVSRSGYNLKEKHALSKIEVKKGRAQKRHDLLSAESGSPLCSKVTSTPRSLTIHRENVHSKSAASRKTIAKVFQSKHSGKTSDGCKSRKTKESQIFQEGKISAAALEVGPEGKYEDDLTGFADGKTPSLNSGEPKSASEDVSKSERTENVKSSKQVCSEHDLKSNEYKKHSAQKQYECKKCLSQFPTANQLKIHRKTHTVSEPKDVHECTICLKTFPNGRRLRAHRTTHTPEERLCPLKRYKCEFCGEEFKKNYFFQIHLRYHKGERPYQCPVCDLAFVTKPERRTHFKKCVVKKKTYLCEQCGSRFGSGCTLRKHERIHTGEKPHQCRFCEKAFSRTNTLKIHERQHTGERPYVCDQCTASFKQRVSLVTHMRSKHNINVTLYSQPRDGPRYTQSAVACKSQNTSEKPAPVEHQPCMPSVVTEYGNTSLQQVAERQISDLKSNSNMFTLAEIDADMVQTSVSGPSLPQPILMSQSSVIHFSTSSSENLVHLTPAAHIVNLPQDIQMMGSSMNQRALVLQENNVLSAIQTPEARVLGIPSQETSIFTLCPSNLSAAMETMYYN